MVGRAWVLVFCERTGRERRAWERVSEHPFTVDAGQRAFGIRMVLASPVPSDSGARDL